MKKSVSVILCIVLLVIGGGLLFRNHAINDVQHERRVVDSLDRVVMIPERPKRIVMLNASNLELFYAVGGADLIVGKRPHKRCRMRFSWQHRMLLKSG